MNYLFFSFVAIIIFILSACNCFFVTKDWLDRSGLIFLFEKLPISQYISIGFALFTLLILIASKFSLSKMQLIFSALITFYSLVIQFYIGLQFFLTPEVPILSKWELWANSLNKKELSKIQKNFHCCGFFKPIEFNRDRCNVTLPGACYESIVKGTMRNFVTTGKIYLQQSAILMIALGFIFVVGRKQNPPKGDSLITQKNIIYREDHGAF